MVCNRSRGLLVWMALFISLLLPLTAFGEMRAAHQVETISCGMTDCHCDCCPMGAAHFSNCRGCNGSLPYLAPWGTISYNWQATPHRLEQITPVFQALGADIFHPPKLFLSEG
jgi:hypothetical protein